MRRAALLALALVAMVPSWARAETELPTANFGGYFRTMARPDLQGGDGTLGFSNIYGRLLNERPFGMLELRLNLLKPRPGSNDVWTALHFQVAGGSIGNVTTTNGRIADFRISQAYALVGNVIQDVTFQLGTLETWFGDLGLYDLRPAQVFFETAGLGARYQRGPFDVFLGVGDSGYFIRGQDYSPIPTLGGLARIHISDHFEIGGGGQLLYEPLVEGNPNAPHFTDAPEFLTYENFLRGEVTQRFLEANPQQLQSFPNPTARDNISFKAVGYLGWGGFGPVRWSNLYASFGRNHPQQRTTELFDFLLAGNRVQGANDLYITHLTDERYTLIAGNELMLTIVPGLLDLNWSVLWIENWDLDNTIAPSELNKQTASTVARAQLYLTDTIHLLAESSVAWEHSKQGNLWRAQANSIFESTNGRSDTRGLEFGDQDTRNTWQGKTGIVINPLGKGIYLRPSIRLLYGVQYSTQNRAYNNNFIDSLDQFNVFGGKQVNWHHVVALETEAWF